MNSHQQIYNTIKRRNDKVIAHNLRVDVVEGLVEGMNRRMLEGNTIEGDYELALSITADINKHIEKWLSSKFSEYLHSGAYLTYRTISDVFEFEVIECGDFCEYLLNHKDCHDGDLTRLPYGSYYVMLHFIEKHCNTYIFERSFELFKNQKYYELLRDYARIYVKNATDMGLAMWNTFQEIKNNNETVENEPVKKTSDAKSKTKQANKARDAKKREREEFERKALECARLQAQRDAQKKQSKKSKK